VGADLRARASREDRGQGHGAGQPARAVRRRADVPRPLRHETDEGKLKEARELILRAKPYWAAFNASSYIKELTIGNIWVAHGYSNDMFQAAADARKAGRPFSIASSTPKEGAVLAVDNFVLHKTGRAPTSPTSSSTSC